MPRMGNGELLIHEKARRALTFCDAFVKPNAVKMKRATAWERRPLRLIYSCSFRAFFRLRLRAKASFTRFFSPGFR